MSGTSHLSIPIEPKYDDIMLTSKSLDDRKIYTQFTFAEGRWYEHRFPIVRFYKTDKTEKNQKGPEEESTEPKTNMVPIIRFAGRYRDDTSYTSNSNSSRQYLPYYDFGSVACGFGGVKVMFKFYAGHNDATCTTWCSNRHVPLVSELCFQHLAVERGRKLVYDIEQQKVRAIRDGEIMGETEYVPPHHFFSDGMFIISKFFGPEDKKAYDVASHVINSNVNADKVLYIGDFAVTDKFMWKHFDLCWNTVASGKTFSWKQCFLSYVYDTPITVNLTFPFTVRNRRLLERKMDFSNWKSEFSEQVASVLGSYDFSILRSVWFDRNTVILETLSRRKIVIFEAPGNDLLSTKEAAETYAYLYDTPVEHIVVDDDKITVTDDGDIIVCENFFIVFIYCTGTLIGFYPSNYFDNVEHHKVNESNHYYSNDKFGEAKELLKKITT